MKKNIKYFVIAWALLLIVFNVVSFLVPGWQTLEKYTPSFWLGYAFISAAFLGQLICGIVAFREDSAKKVFYKISLFTMSFAGLACTFVVGLICMIVAPLPYWVGAIVCPVVLVVNVVALLKASAAVSLVSDIDSKVEAATSFIYDMRAESESLFVRAKTDDDKALCKKVRDAFKFSDPMSKDELESVELDINTHFENLKKAVLAGESDTAASEADEVLALIAERNNACKRLK